MCSQVRCTHHPQKDGVKFVFTRYPARGGAARAVISILLFVVISSQASSLIKISIYAHKVVECAHAFCSPFHILVYGRAQCAAALGLQL